LSHPLNDKKTINAWAFYDWANSVFPLVITAAIFPPFYESMTERISGSDLVEFLGFPIKNTVLYSYAFSFSFLLIAFLSPFLSGIADYKGNKKSFMRFFVIVGAISCMLLFFFDGSNLLLGLAAIIAGNIGFNGSLVFYNAYLPEIATLDQRDRVSAKGFSIGYIGGFVLLVINLLIILNAKKLGFKNDILPYQFSFLSVGIWWILFSQYSFMHLPKRTRNMPLQADILLKGFKELRKVFFFIISNKHIRPFLIAFFLYSMGVQTVLYMASLYGAKVVNVSTENLIISILLIQLVATAGAQLFAFLSSLIGNIRSLMISLFIWILVCIIAFMITTTASLVGLVMGGIQSLSRSTYAKMIPENHIDTASFFSFYEFTEKLAIVLGIASYGFVEALSGNMRNSALLLSVFFFSGMIGLFFVKIDHTYKTKKVAL